MRRPSTAQMLLGRRSVAAPPWPRAMAFAAAAAAVMVVVVLTTRGGRARALLERRGQMLALGEAYPYIRTPYADSERPFGYQAPAQYPVYPYEAGASYANVQPYYDALGQSKAPAAHDWFPDAVNTGTGPLTPLWTAMQGKQRQSRQVVLRQGVGPGMRRAMRAAVLAAEERPAEERAPPSVGTSSVDGCVCAGPLDEDQGPRCVCPGDPGFGDLDSLGFSPNEVTSWAGDETEFKGAPVQTLALAAPGVARSADLRGRIEYSPTYGVSGGQYSSPVLPTENEAPAWSVWGDGWQDHTYYPSVSSARRSQRQAQLQLSVPGSMRQRGLGRGRGRGRGGEDGFQQLAHVDWETKGHSNNYMGMQAPVRNVNALGDHQVGFSDRIYPAVVNGTAVSDPEEGDLVVDKALRAAWNVFAGNDDIATVVAPKMGYSLDNQVACEDEEDPALCAQLAAGGRPVSEVHTNPRWIPGDSNAGLNPGVLSSDGHGVVPAGGGLRTYKGRRGDLIRDCRGAACHESLPPYERSRILDGAPPRTVDMRPLWEPVQLPVVAGNVTAANATVNATSGDSGDEPQWLHVLRTEGGYTGP